MIVTGTTPPTDLNQHSDRYRYHCDQMIAQQKLANTYSEQGKGIVTGELQKGWNAHMDAYSAHEAAAKAWQLPVDPNRELISLAAIKSSKEAAAYDATVNRTGPPAFVK